MVDGGNPFAWRQSSLETYLRCGLRWRYEHEGKKHCVTRAMAIGTGVHGAQAEDLTALTKTATSPPRQHIIDAAVFAYDREFDTHEHEVALIDKGKGRDIVKTGAAAYVELIAPQYRRDVVLAVERKLEAHWGDLSLEGTLDVITDLGVGDLKTGRAWTQRMVDNSRQLTAYALLYEANYGKLPRRVWIKNLKLDQAKWTWSVPRKTLVESFRTEQQLEAYMYLMESALASLEAGVFNPAPDGAWWCSAGQCPHWRYCPAFSGRMEEF